MTNMQNSLVQCEMESISNNTPSELSCCIKQSTSEQRKFNEITPSSLKNFAALCELERE